MGPDAITVDLALPAGPGVPRIIPDNVDMNAMREALLNGDVYAPEDQVDALRTVVADAREQGHDMNFVVLTEAQPKFTIYRDIATELQTHTGGTVIVLGPNSVGSASPDFSRVVQEEATEGLTLQNPPQAARQMLDHMTGPNVDWTLVTVLLIVVVVVGAVVARVTSLRGRGPADDGSDAKGSSVPGTPVGESPATD